MMWLSRLREHFRRTELRAVCTCGDWQDDHILNVGECRVCAWHNDPTGVSSPRPCLRYVYAGAERRKVYS